MIVQAIYIQDEVQQYCVFTQEGENETPLACFSTEQECLTWIEDHAN